MRGLRQYATWTFPIVTFAVAFAMQIVLPPLLQIGMSAEAYTAYIAVVSLATYVTLSDGGMLVPLTREMTALHAEKKFEEYLGEQRRAVKVYAITSFLGLVVTSSLIWVTLAPIAQEWATAGQRSFVLATFLVLLGSAAEFAIGGVHTAVTFSVGRLLTYQLLATGNVVFSALVLVPTLMISRDLTTGLYAMAAQKAAVALGKSIHMMMMLRPLAGHAVGRPRAPLLKFVVSGGLFRLGETGTQALFPHLLAIWATGMVVVAIPVRTLASACRLISQQFVYLLEVHITRRMNETEEVTREASDLYHMCASLLAAGQLFMVGGMSVLAHFVFSLWLPQLTDRIDVVMPGLLAEQVFLSAAFPATILFVAKDRITTWGIGKTAGAALGLGVFAIGVGSWDDYGYGWGLATTALPVFLIGGWVELRHNFGIHKAALASGVRYAAAAILVGCCFFHRQNPHIFEAVAVLAACTQLVIGIGFGLRVTAARKAATH